MPDFDDFSGFIDLEAGDYSHERFKAAFNLPLHDTLAVRFAALSLTRDGYIENLAYNQVAADGTTLPNIDDDIDGRDYKAGRITVLWKPTDKFSAWLQFSDFDENDDRARITNQVCARTRYSQHRL